MKRLFIIIFIGFVIALPACFEDDSSGGGFNASIVINITNSSGKGGTFLAAVYDFPDIDVTNKDTSQMEGFGYITDITGSDGGTININGIGKETVYLAVILDENANNQPDTDEYYYLHDGKTVGSDGDPITLTDGGTESIDITFPGDALVYGVD